MSLKDELAAAKQDGIKGSKPRPKHPTGFEPGLNTEKGEIVGAFVSPLGESEYEDAFVELLVKWGFDPDKFTIEDDRVEIRTWNNGQVNEATNELVMLWYYKAKIVRRRAKLEFDGFIDRVRERPIEKSTAPPGHLTYVVLNGDWQLGKRDGDGTDGIAERIIAGIGAVSKDIDDARTEGYQVDKLVIGNLGDIVEGCTGFYPMQEAQVELDRREQINVAVELMDRQIEALFPLFDRTLLVAVPGNHGEHRKEGKAFTSFGDNDDVLAVESVFRAYSKSERYKNVGLHVTKNDLTTTLDLSGTIVTFAHSHQASRSSGARWGHIKTLDWWRDQSFGRQGAKDADLLVTGHFHYYAVTQIGDRMHIQIPALDGGSQWYQETRGIPTSQGVVTVVVGDGKVHRTRLLDLS